MIKSVAAKKLHGVLGPFDNNCDPITVRTLIQDCQIVAHGRICVVAQNYLFNIAAKSFGLRLSNDPALIQNRDFVGYRLDFVQKVRTVKHRSPFALQMRNEIAIELLSHDRIEAQRRIVQNDKLRPMASASTNPEPHILPLRQMLDASSQRQLEIAQVLHARSWSQVG